MRSRTPGSAARTCCLSLSPPELRHTPAGPTLKGLFSIPHPQGCCKMKFVLPLETSTTVQIITFCNTKVQFYCTFGSKNEIICPVVGFPGGSYGPILRIYDSGRLPLQLLLETWHLQPSLISSPKYILLYFGSKNEIWLAVPVFQEKLKGQSLRVVRP